MQVAAHLAGDLGSARDSARNGLGNEQQGAAEAPTGRAPSHIAWCSFAAGLVQLAGAEELAGDRPDRQHHAHQADEDRDVGRARRPPAPPGRVGDVRADQHGVDGAERQHRDLADEDRPGERHDAARALAQAEPRSCRRSGRRVGSRARLPTRRPPPPHDAARPAPGRPPHRTARLAGVRRPGRGARVRHRRHHAGGAFGARLDLAALAIGGATYITVFIGLMGVVLAIGPIAGQLFGAQAYHDCGGAAAPGDLAGARAVADRLHAAARFRSPSSRWRTPSPRWRKVRGYLSRSPSRCRPRCCSPPTAASTPRYRGRRS